MSGVVFVEEQSAEHIVLALAQRYGLSESIQVVPHEGKNDLERSFARKIPAWRHPPDVRFLVTRDNDGADCRALKARLQGRLSPDFVDRTCFRIVMQELESWYLGDFSVLVSAGLIQPVQAVKLGRKAQYRNPDNLTNASEIVHRLVGVHGKIELARLIGPHLDPANNRSSSLQQFITALRWVAA